MADKFPKPGEDRYCEAVEAWITVHLKKREDMENPPRQSLYDEWYEQLDDYNDNKIVRLEPNQGMKRCTCKTKSDKHACDCRIHPHRMVILLDSTGIEFAVESLFLEPTSWDEELLEMIMGSSSEDQSSKSAESIASLEKVEPAEAIAEVISASTLETEQQIEVLETVKQSEKPSSVEEIPPNSCMVEKKYALVTFSRDGQILCEDACLSKNPAFIFNQDAGEWLYGDVAAKVGDIIFLEEGVEISVAVIEADFEQLQFLVLSLKCLLQKIIKKEIVAKILED